MLLIRYGKKRKNISKKNVKERIKAKRKRQGKKDKISKNLRI